jgi:hypothetical protein
MREHIPEWYKKSEITYTEDHGDHTHEHNGLKTCVPFLDALLSGYCLTTWTDVHIKIEDEGKIHIDFGDDVTSPIIAERTKTVGYHMPRPAGHLPNHLVWTPKWGFKSPKGFSSLIVHPLNRFDLPFTTSSGIIDSDKFHGSGNVPFFLKEGFEGVIPKGTPFAQIIPIKREEWMAVYDPSMVDIIPTVGEKLRAANRGYYRDNYWVKKVYKLMGGKDEL